MTPEQIATKINKLLEPLTDVERGQAIQLVLYRFCWSCGRQHPDAHDCLCALEKTYADKETDQ